MTHFYTRREFLRNSTLVSASLALPFFLGKTAVFACPQETTSSLPGFPDNRILVVVQLGGGNDGLNTVVPYKNDHYFRLRQRLRLSPQELLSVNDEIAFHTSMAPLKDLYDQGKMAVVHGVGYPNPNRSHFRSMEIWQTASDSDRYLREGWIGRYLDKCSLSTPPNVCAIQIGAKREQAFDSKSDLGVAFDNPQTFRWYEGFASDSQKNFRRLNKIQADSTLPQGDSSLMFLRSISSNAVVSSDKVNEIAKKERLGNNHYQEGGRLGRDLKQVTDLIVGGLPTRIFYVTLGGFDTHAGQVGKHPTLLSQWSNALAAFYQDLKQNKLSDRVLILCFSEFGRRVSENASGGTDHGTAGPVFLLGDSVRPGFHGTYPSLTDLDRGDLKFTVDFRSVYATVLEEWLKTNPVKVLERTFEKLPLLRV
jgi:uncharacterized protein (DUF1501 family)